MSPILLPDDLISAFTFQKTTFSMLASTLQVLGMWLRWIALEKVWCTGEGHSFLYMGLNSKLAKNFERVGSHGSGML